MPFLLFTVFVSSAASLMKLGALTVMVDVLRATVVVLLFLVVFLAVWVVKLFVRK